MQLQGSTANLQGGSGISLGNFNPQPSANIPIQGGTGVNQQPRPAPAPSIAPTVNQDNSSIAATQALLAALKANQPAVAPTLDINAIRSSAQSQAANNVNPLYNQYLNEFLQNQAAETSAQQANNQASIQNLQAQLQNSLQVSQDTRTATQQNTQLDLGNIANQEQNYQQSAGNQFDAARQSEQSQTGASGLAGSGMALQGDQQMQQNENLKQAAQEGQYTYSAAQKQLLESQTFEQLANSDSLSKLKETEGENTANFNLNSYLRQAADSKQREQEALTEWQQQAIAAQTQNLIAQSVSGRLSGLSGPTMAAAASAWAPYLQTVSAPTAPRSLLV